MAQPPKHPDLLLRGHDAARRGRRRSAAAAAARSTTARQLCRAELERFRAAPARRRPLTVGCTQEAPLFSRSRRRADAGAIAFVNIRETAGWSKRRRAGRAEDGGAARGRRRAAARRSARQPRRARASIADLRPRRAARSRPRNLLADHLDVTVLITPPGDVAPPRVTEFPGGARARSASAKGHLGAFELTVDDLRRARAVLARRAASSAPPRNGAVSRCDLVLDLSGGAPLFPAHDLRDGYLRADPGDPAAVLRAVLKARDLVGTLRQAALHHLHRGPLRAFALAASSAATAASTSARPARSRRPAITSRSTPISAPAAASAPPPARPAPRPTRCRRPMR